MKWWIVQVLFSYNMTLNGRDRSDNVQSMMKTRLDSDVIDYMSALRWKWNWTYCDWSDGVWFMTKIRQDNNVTDRTSAVYAKFGTKLSW